MDCIVHGVAKWLSDMTKQLSLSLYSYYNMQSAGGENKCIVVCALKNVNINSKNCIGEEFYIFLTAPHGLWGLSSLSRD